jgi:hypothetical protein
VSERIAIDFDETLTEGAPPRLKAGALDALVAAKKAGHHLILHSCRSTVTGHSPILEDEATRFWRDGTVPAPVRFQWDLFDEMRSVLTAAGALALFDEIWQSPGKPLADKYVDDRAEFPDWATFRRQFGI